MSPFRLLLFVALVGSLTIRPSRAEDPGSDVLAAAGLSAGVVVTVLMSDGRVASGTVDECTDERLLWIRGETPRAQIRSGLSWAEVVSISQGTRPDTIRITADNRFGIFADALPGSADVWSDRAVASHNLSPWLPRGFAVERGVSELSQRVTTLQIETTVANWDRDATVDGILVRLIPLNRHRQIVPVTGSVSFELVGQHRPATGGRSINRTRQFPTLERWTVRLRPDDYDDWGAVVELPFRQYHPQTDLDIAPEGLLYARLSVPGQGVYEATDDWLPLRLPSRMRDDHQLWQGGRLFPQERYPRSR